MARASRNFTWVTDLPLEQMSNHELYEAYRDKKNPRKKDAGGVLMRRLKSRRGWARRLSP